ncbi:MAG: DUF2784 domain-containing protein [Deltaproteobacteria bacterium]|jgi:hypothetical protein|nr:DUF2784 domain-containing protein [Deltaproteobacteria bacterium]
MGYQIAADLILTLHFLFVLFVVLGGLLSLHRRIWILLHLPAAFWGVWVEWSGKVCPLTPLENYFRELSGRRGYSETFVEHYLLPILYPEGLTRPFQWALGILVILVNVIIYGFVYRRNITKQRPG